MCTLARNLPELTSVLIIAYNLNVHFARNAPFSQTRSHMLQQLIKSFNVHLRKTIFARKKRFWIYMALYTPVCTWCGWRNSDVGHPVCLQRKFADILDTTELPPRIARRGQRRNRPVVSVVSVVVCICGKRKRRESIRLLSPYIVFSVVSSSVGVRGRRGGWSEYATRNGRAGSQR